MATKKSTSPSGTRSTSRSRSSTSPSGTRSTSRSRSSASTSSARSSTTTSPQTAAKNAGYNAEPSDAYDPVAAHIGDGSPTAAEVKAASEEVNP